MKSGKAAGVDGIFPEFIKSFGTRTKWWLLKFMKKILRTSNVPALLKKVNIMAVLKPEKDPKDPESYRPIALLSVIYKLLERLIGTRADELMDAKVPQAQPAFRKDRNCTEQVLAFTSFVVQCISTCISAICQK